MFRRSILVGVALLTVLGAVPRPASGNPITYYFSGQVWGVTDPTLNLADLAPVAGCFTFDPATVDSNPDPLVGWYDQDGGSGFVMVAGQQTYATRTFRIGILYQPSEQWDVYYLRAEDIGVSVWLEQTGSFVLGSDALPSHPPAIGEQYNSGPGFYFRLHSISVPEPGTWVLMVVGICLFASEYRSNRRRCSRSEP